jgi:hypothetical protein
VSCFAGSVPPFTYPHKINEDQNGGYFPYTSDVFNLTNATDVFSITAGETVANINIFPRPEIGKAYAVVMWRTASGNASNKAFHMNTILPTTFGFTQVNHDAGQLASSCDYPNRPAANGTCLRDVSWRDIGGWDVSKLPYTRDICLHRYGERTSGWINSAANGCPYEGTTECLTNHPDNQTSPKLTVGRCALAQNSSNPICISCGADSAHSCSQTGIWQDCARIKYGPVATLTNFAAMQNAPENVQFTFVGWGSTAASFTSTIQNQNYAYKAYVAYTRYTPGTESQLIQVNPPASGSGYVWHIGDIVPTNGGSFIQSNEFKGTDSDSAQMAATADDAAKPMQGLACFSYLFQCGGNSYCVKDGDNTKINSVTRSCFTPSEQTACEQQAGYSCGPLDATLYHQLNW